MERKRKDRQINLPSLIHCPVATIARFVPGWSQELGNSIHISYMDGRDPSIWTMVSCLLRHISRKLDQKCSIWNLNWCFKMGCCCPRWQLNILCHNPRSISNINWYVSLKGTPRSNKTHILMYARLVHLLWCLGRQNIKKHCTVSMESNK